MFLQSTLVESGRRIIASNICLDGSFSDVEDILTVVGHDIRLSTAADLSSRFPYISPPATLRKAGKQSEVYGHAVDGGYHENFGATTAFELVHTLIDQIKLRRRQKDVHLVVILISNDVKLPSSIGAWEGTIPTEDRLPDPLGAGLEVRSPPLALLKTRDARGWVAVEHLQRLVEGSACLGTFVHFRLHKDTSDPPLGRILSKEQKKNIRCEAEHPESARAFEVVRELLPGRD